MDDGLPELIEAPGGPALRFHGRALYSERDPRSLPERSARSFDARPGTLVVCPSPLLGYGLDSLLSRLDRDSLLLCVEAEPALLELSLRSLPREILDDPRVTVSALHPDGSLGGRLPDLSRVRRAALLPLSGGYALHRGLYDAFVASLQSEMRRRLSNRATLTAMGRLWTRNLVRNIPLLARARPLAELQEAARGKPIALLGAGPSLEAAFGPVARAGRGAFVVVVDTALSALMGAGVVPDAVVCLEAQVHNAADFIGNACLPCPLVADLTSHSAPLRFARNGLHFVASDFAPLALLSRMRAAGLLPEELPPLGSVGVAALRIALAIGDPSMPVTVAGLDFSFERGKTHARGSAPHAAALSSSWRLAESSAWRASVRPGTRAFADPRSGKSLIEDPALSGYAALFRMEAEAFSSGLRDMRSQGADLGLRRPSPGEDPFLPLGSPRGVLPLSAVAAPDRSVLKDFVEGELDAVARLRRGLSGEAPLSEEELRSSLAAEDYLYVHFPDGGGDPIMERHFLARVSVEADSFIPRLERAAAALV